MSALTFVFPIAVILMIGFLLLHLELAKKTAIQPRRGRFGAVGALLITAVYGVTAFIGLGDRVAPQTFYVPVAGERATITFQQPERIGRVMFYAGIGKAKYEKMKDKITI